MTCQVHDDLSGLRVTQSLAKTAAKLAALALPLSLKQLFLDDDKPKRVQVNFKHAAASTTAPARACQVMLGLADWQAKSA
jgi:hypothetical protein